MTFHAQTHSVSLESFSLAGPLNERILVTHDPLRYRHQNLGELITNPSPNYVKTHFCWFSESNMKTTPTRPLACRCSANRCRQRSRLQAQLSQKSDHNESLVRLQEETARIHTKYQNRSIRNILYRISYNYITYIIYIVMYIHINYKCIFNFIVQQPFLWMPSPPISPFPVCQCSSQSTQYAFLLRKFADVCLASVLYST